MGTRRLLLLGTGALALVFFLSSAAYACTIYKGYMTVSGTSSSTGIGSNSGMTYCGGTTPANADVLGGTAFTVSVAPKTDAPCKGNLGNITADVNYAMGAGPPQTTDCMTGSSGVSNLGTLSITNGTGNTNNSYTIPTTAGTGDAQVCVSKKPALLQTQTGMQIPVTLS